MQAAPLSSFLNSLEEHLRHHPKMSNSSSSSSFPVKFWNKSGILQPIPTTIHLSTLENGISEIILDYGRAVGGILFFEAATVQSENDAAMLEVTYSGTRAGIDKEKGTSNNSRNQLFTDFQQAMDHSCYFRTQWIRTESTNTHSLLLKVLNTSSQDSRKSPNDSRNSFSNHQTPSHFPQSVSDIKDQQLRQRVRSSVRISC